MQSESQVHTPRAAHQVDFQDQRRTPGQRLRLDADALDCVLAVTGVHTQGDLRVRLRLRDQHGGGQGLCQRLGHRDFRVIVAVAPKPAYDHHHLYVLNNSLIHELRHVAQHLNDPQMAVKYAQATLTVGYAHNPYEVEARLYGRLADHTGKKDTGHLGEAGGVALWALVPEEPTSATASSATSVGRGRALRRTTGETDGRAPRIAQDGRRGR